MGWAGQSSQLFFAASRNPDVDLLPAHRTHPQDGASPWLRTLPERIEKELHALADRFV